MFRIYKSKVVYFNINTDERSILDSEGVVVRDLYMRCCFLSLHPDRRDTDLYTGCC